MLYFDPGTEWAIIPARKALEKLRAQSKELGLATMSKHLDMGSGVMVDLQVTEFQDRIRITGQQQQLGEVRWGRSDGGL